MKSDDVTYFSSEITLVQINSIQTLLQNVVLENVKNKYRRKWLNRHRKIILNLQSCLITVTVLLQ